MGGFSGISKTADCPADDVCNGNVGSGGVNASSASSRRCSIFIILLFISCLHGTFGYSTNVAECGSPSNPKFTSGIECSGCAFSAVDINTFNIANDDKGCVAGLSGMYAGSSAAKGYHCLTVRTTSSGVSCSVHRTCASKNATDSNTKSCIYTMGGFSGISKTADCPADDVCNGGTAGNGAVSASSASSSSRVIFIALFSVVAVVLMFQPR